MKQSERIGTGYLGRHEDELTWTWQQAWEPIRAHVRSQAFLDQLGPSPTPDMMVTLACNYIDRGADMFLLTARPAIINLLQQSAFAEQERIEEERRVEKADGPFNPFRPNTRPWYHWMRRNGKLPPQPVLDPVSRYLQAAENLTLDWVQGITAGQKTQVRALIVAAFKKGQKAEDIAQRVANVIGLNQRWTTAVENLTAHMVASGVQTRWVRRRAVKYADELLKKRGIMVARTEMMTAFNAGVYEAWKRAQDAGELEGWKVLKWLQPMEDACAECWAAADPNATGEPLRVEGVDGRFGETDIAYPPLHPHCFPAGTLVSGPLPEAFITRHWYGELVEITFGQEQQLTGTANHPVLTRNGWIALGELREGDEIICYIPTERECRGDENDYQMPTLIEQISATGVVAGTMTTRQVPVTSEDFHGDGTGSKIATIWTDSQLRNEGLPGLSQPLGQIEFIAAIRSCFSLTRLSDSMTMLKRLGSTTYSIVSGLRVVGMIFRSSATHHQSVGSRDGSNVNSVANQEIGDSTTTDPTLVRKLIDARTGMVVTNEIIRVRRLPASNHQIYSLQTSEGWHTANGVVVSNCRCEVKYELVALDASR